MERVRVPQLVLFACCVISAVESQRGNCPDGKWAPPGCRNTCSPDCGGSICEGSNGHCADCGARKWGLPSCKNTCSPGCAGSICEDSNGHCVDCVARKWGLPSCKNPCSPDCAGSICEDSNGHCVGCKRGYRGTYCTKQCDTHTARCVECDQQTGRCTACDQHFLPPACTGYCKSQETCQQCSSGCSNRQCDIETGSCSECEDGYYKQDAARCNTCPVTCYNNSQCNKTTGHCDECSTGKTGDTCIADCDGGQYGPSRCSLSCGQCEDGHQCHPVTGHCLCVPGLYPPLCNEDCNNKTYGVNCSESCGKCKGGQPCDTVTGSCTTGCEPGYTGQLCKTNCQAGMYGDGCNTRCGYCRVNTTCHHQHGYCLEGCVPGLTAPFCLKVKSVSENDRLVVPVVGSVIGAAVIIVIGIVGVFCCFRRSRAGPLAKRNGRATVKEPELARGDKATDSQGHQPTEEDTTYCEISDTGNILEMRKMETNYEKLQPYSNEDSHAYSQITPQ